MPRNTSISPIRSEEVQEILTKVPNWMIRWGNTLFFLLILLLLFISWFIKYPDIIASEIMVTSTIPPEKIYTRTTGKFETILVKEADTVTSGEILAIIENSASYKDILLLKKSIDTIQPYKNNFTFPIHELPPMILGDVTSSFAQFENDYSEYILNKALTPLKPEKSANQHSILETKRRLHILLSQKEIYQKELVYQKNDIERSRAIFKKGVISRKEKEQKEIAYLQSKRAYQNLENSISQMRELVANSSKNLKATTIRKTQNDIRLKNKAVQSFLYLKKALKDWENKYALTSSIEGTVSFISYWNQNQTVQLGDFIFSVIPTQNTSYIGKVKAPAMNSGKIKKGQKVQIQVLNYPADEYGELNGDVQSVSQLPDKNGYYIINVSLPKKLITTYDKEIAFKQEMQGTAHIITEDLRLIERFFYQLKHIIT